MLKNKKKAEIVQDNFSGLIIGILILVGIGLFTYVLIQNLFLTDERTELPVFLESLEEKIKIMPEDQEISLPLIGLTNTIIIGYDKLESERPQKCFLPEESCICAIKTEDAENFGSLGEAIQQYGHCQKFEQDKINITTKQEFYKNLNGPDVGTSFSVKHELTANCIIMNNQLWDFQILKTKDQINIRSERPAFESLAETAVERIQEKKELNKKYEEQIMRHCKILGTKRLEEITQGEQVSSPGLGGGV